MELLYNFFIIILLINGLFWSLATHKQHCDLGKMLNIKSCFNHGVHLTIGVISLLMAIALKQRDYLSRLL